MKKTGFTTTALNVKYAKSDPHNALQIPVYDSIAFEFESAEQIEANFKGEYIAHVYSRTSNPTVEFLESKLKTLTEGFGVLAVSSGMAAISNTLLSVCKAGDNFIAGNQLFGHTYALFNQTFADLAIEARFSALENSAEIEKLIDDKTRAIYFETVTNPQLNIVDIEMLTEISKKHDLILICDSTMTPPNVFKAGNFGINIEVLSATKYLSGGANAFGGIIIDHGNTSWEKNPCTRAYFDKFGKGALIARLRKNIFRNTGTSMTPQTAKLLIQGIDVLELRVQRCYENCLALGKFLSENKNVKRVDYPGLKSDLRYNLALKQFNGIPGTILSLDLASKEACFDFMNKLKLIRRATNLNDNKSLIIHPFSTIYSEFPESERAEAGIRDTMMRLSVGIENTNDLVEDISQALT